MARHRLSTVGLLLLVAIGLYIRLIQVRVRDAWQSEVTVLLQRNIPLGTSRKKAEKWIYVREIPADWKWYREAGEDPGVITAACIPTKLIHSHTPGLHDTVVVELTFDAKGNLKSYDNMQLKMWPGL